MGCLVITCSLRRKYVWKTLKTCASLSCGQFSLKSTALVNVLFVFSMKVANNHFETLLARGGSNSMHVKNLQKLMTEIYKSKRIEDWTAENILLIKNYYFSLLCIYHFVNS